MNIALDGKFFGAPPTGVQRVAGQLVAATDALITKHSGHGADYALVMRSSAKAPSYCKTMCVQEDPLVRRMHRIAWEQADILSRTSGMSCRPICDLLAGSPLGS